MRAQSRATIPGFSPILCSARVELSLVNSLLANLTANCAGASSPSSSDYNLSSDASCTSFTQPHDMQNVNPLIGPLANNGGPTQTHALLPGSPAVDRIPAVGANCPAIDQRGIARPQGLACDIGAYEATPAVAPVSRPSDPLSPTGPPQPVPLPRSGISPAGTGVNASGPTPAPPMKSSPLSIAVVAFLYHDRWAMERGRG